MMRSVYRSTLSQVPWSVRGKTAMLGAARPPMHAPALPERSDEIFENVSRQSETDVRNQKTNV